MKSRNKKYIAFLSFFLIILNFNLFSPKVAAIDIPITGTSVHRDIQPFELVTFNFVNYQNYFSIRTDTFINFHLEYDFLIIFRQVFLIINNTNPIFLNISCRFDLAGFLSQLPEDPTLEDLILTYDYSCVYRICSNSTIDHLAIRFMKREIFGINPLSNYTIAFFQKGLESWIPIITSEQDQKNSPGTYLEGNISNLEGNTEYFFTLYEVKEEENPTEDNWINFLLIIGIPSFIIIIGLIVILSKEEYLNYIKRKINFVNKGAHRLSLKEVLDNEKRNLIIDIILKNPGIHFNELLRKTKLSPGNLVWHLDILETYKVIGKKRFENYVVYFPLYQKNPISYLNLKLQKSDLTLKVLELIENNPGIWNNRITKNLKINRKTIQYHIKKLINLELIYAKKEGKKKKLYINTKSEYFNNKI